jgi:NAD kinase
LNKHNKHFLKNKINIKISKYKKNVEIDNNKHLFKNNGANIKITRNKINIEIEHNKHLFKYIIKNKNFKKKNKHSNFS